VRPGELCPPLRPASEARAEFREKARLSAGTLLPPLRAISRRFSALIDAKPRFGEFSSAPMVVLQAEPYSLRLKTDDPGGSSRPLITYSEVTDVLSLYRPWLVRLLLCNAGIIQQILMRRQAAQVPRYPLYGCRCGVGAIWEGVWLGFRRSAQQGLMVRLHERATLQRHSQLNSLHCPRRSLP
jgi:hypothetical protein